MRNGHVYSHVDLKWDGLKLRLKSGRMLATVEWDSKWPKMCRVRLPDGRLTDMANLTWAKDATISLACADLNKHRHDMAPVAAPPMRQNPEAATSSPRLGCGTPSPSSEPRAS